ncbi:hypothetical protein [Methylotenera mobilis]|jgi:hypothetical protein|uniref:hypothetical protein n=1 Tax=Methylotenera mobilis TaxID=359408 RepID=UPI00036C2CD5|nr:hypothetical protein [Methylotenera mobilis]
MNYIEFRRHLGKAGITVEKFSSLIGVRANSVSNYSKKEQVPAQYAIIAILMGESVDRGIDVIAMLSKFGIRFQSSREGNIANINDFRISSNKSEI